MTISPAPRAADTAPGDAGGASPGPLALGVVVEMARELAAAVGAALVDFGAWRAAASGLDVADFRPRPRSWLPAFARLPVEQPMVPLSRGPAAAGADRDAWATVGHLLGVENEGALAAAAPTAPFVRAGLDTRPSEPRKAGRVLALALALRYLEAAIADRAAGDATAFADHAAGVLGAAPSGPVAAVLAAEHGLARLPGEERTLYARTRAAGEAILRGVALASALRDAHDEDWFDNPRLTRETLARFPRPPAPADPAPLVRWLTDAARL